MLNVASPGKTHFSEEELVLLQSVAFQIGTALKRTKLYENEKRRAHYYVKLERFIQDLKMIHKFNVLPEKVVNHVGEVFQWNQVALLLGRKRIISASILRSGRVTRGCKRGGQEGVRTR